MIPSSELVAQTFPFLKKNSRLVRDFAAQALFKTLPERTRIYTEGDSCDQIAFVLSGEIRVFKANESGREITLYEIGPGDTCILNASCILSKTGYPANAFTPMKTEVLLLPAAEFKRLLDTYQEIQVFVYTMLSYRLTAVMALIEEIVFNRMDRRLFDYLLERSETASSPEHIRALPMIWGHHARWSVVCSRIFRRGGRSVVLEAKLRLLSINPPFCWSRDIITARL